MTPDQIETAANRDALSIFGTLPTTPEDSLAPGTILLLGPHEPGFWAHVTAAPEFADNKPDPLDRWSRRVITALARTAGGTPLFPFGQPTRPFIGWALRSGRAWSSPVGLLVHDRAGLMVSYRGAILLPGAHVQSAAQRSPCEPCETKPCLTECPVGALTSDGYDIPGCHEFLDSAAGEICMTQGCAVRVSCPVSQSYQRLAQQSAFHMRQFHP
ncbi:MAG: ferredoxin [Pseudomonadota bacterium]